MAEAKMPTQKLKLREGKAEVGVRASVGDIGGFDERGDDGESNDFDRIDKRVADGQKERFGHSFGLVALIEK